MIEIFNIFIFVLLVSLLILPNKSLLVNLNKKNIKYSNFEISSLNLLIILNILWFSSVVDISKFYVFLVILSFTTINTIMLLHNFNKKDVFKGEIISYLLIFIITFLISIIIAHDLFFSHDVRLFWFEKTIMFYNDFFVTSDDTIKPEYPHFGTYLWAFFWKFNFLDYEYFGRIFYAFIYTFSIYFLINKIKFKKEFIKYFIFIFIIFLTLKIKWFDGRQDILLFSFNLFAFAFLHELIFNKSTQKIHVVGFLLTVNLLIWIKIESILYIFSYFIVILYYIRGHRKLVLLFSIIFLLSIKFLFYEYYNIEAHIHSDVFATNFFTYIKNLDLLARVSQVFLWYFVGIIRNPILLISIIFLFFIFLENKKYFIKHSYLFLIYFIISIGIFFVYTITTYDFPFHMIGSFGRVFLQFSMIFLIPILKFFENKKMI
tara:strand:+ start:11246 stop:12538 length:1293 start_codon:yes stop_codon:yes gene_type:complete